MIPKKIKELRKSKGLSQEELALHLHESQNTISNIETGKQKTISLPLMYKIAAYFQVELYELLSENGTDAKTGSPISNGHDDTRRMLPVSQYCMELINALKEQLSIKDQQLDEKDRQIRQLLELLKFTSCPQEK